VVAGEGTTVSALGASAVFVESCALVERCTIVAIRRIFAFLSIFIILKRKFQIHAGWLVILVVWCQISRGSEFKK
jgi:hypothetical protein